MPDPIDPDTELDTHIVFFDRNRDGTITREEIHRALVELGFRDITARILTPILGLLPAEVEALRRLRHDDSGSFSADGAFDEEAFLRWWQDTDRDDSGDVSRWELLLGSVKLADDPASAVASIAEFQLVHGLLAEDGRLTRDSVQSFLDGELFRRIIAARTDVE